MADSSASSPAWTSHLGLRSDLGEQDQHHRADHRPEDGADAADDADQHHLHRDVDAEGDVGVDEADVEGEEAAGAGGEGRRDHQRQVLVEGGVDAEAVGGVLVLADGLEGVAELGVLHEPVDRDDDHRQPERGVEEGHLAEELHREPGGLQRGDAAEQDPLGAAGHVLEVERRQPDDLGHGDGGQHEVGAAQPEGDGADDHREDHRAGHGHGDAVPGGDLVQLQQEHGDVGAHPEVGGVAHRVLAGVAPHHVPGRALGDGQEDHDPHVEDERLARELRDQRHQGDDRQVGEEGRGREAARGAERGEEGAHQVLDLPSRPEGRKRRMSRKRT